MTSDHQKIICYRENNQIKKGYLHITPKVMVCNTLLVYFRFKFPSNQIPNIVLLNTQELNFTWYVRMLLSLPLKKKKEEYFPELNSTKENPALLEFFHFSVPSHFLLVLFFASSLGEIRFLKKHLNDLSFIFN